MFKKFFKKLGKGIKKVSKGITKGLKSLFKSKVGKIIGTVALMFIAPYLLSSAGSFFAGSLGSSVAGGTAAGSAAGTAAGSAATGTEAGSAAAGTAAGTKAATIGQKMVTAFKNVGAKMKNAYNTVTEGIKNFFTGGTGTTGTTSVTDSVASGVGDTFKSVDFASDATVSAGKLPTVGTDNIAKIKPPPDTSTVVTDALGEQTITKVKPAIKPESLLDKPKFDIKTGTEDLLRPSDISTQLAKDTSIKFKDRLAQAYQSVTQDPTTGAPAESFTEAYTNIKKIKPLESFESLPKIVQGTSVGEAKYLYDVTRPVEEPYQQPQVDVGLAMSSLAEVDMTGSGANQLPSSMPLDISMAPKPMDASAWLNMVNKHGYLYSASKFGQTA